MKKLAQLNDSKFRKEDNLEMTDLGWSDAVLSQQVVLSEDLLSKIFEQLSLLKPSGFADAEVARSVSETPGSHRLEMPPIPGYLTQCCFDVYKSHVGGNDPRLSSHKTRMSRGCVQVWACLPGLETGFSAAAPNC